MSRSSTLGTVYLICFDRPFHHARHYIGWALDPVAREAQHRAGRGSRLLAAVAHAGIGWSIVRTWEGADRNFERRLKNQRQHHTFCPRCREAKMHRKMQLQATRRALKNTRAGVLTSPPTLD